MSKKPSFRDDRAVPGKVLDLVEDYKTFGNLRSVAAKHDCSHEWIRSIFASHGILVADLKREAKQDRENIVLDIHDRTRSFEETVKESDLSEWQVERVFRKHDIPIIRRRTRENNEKKAKLVMHWLECRKDGMTAIEAAKSLGVAYTLLYRWQKRDEIRSLMEIDR